MDQGQLKKLLDCSAQAFGQYLCLSNRVAIDGGHKVRKAISAEQGQEAIDTVTALLHQLEEINAATA